jgi:hypothetical protein
VGADLEAIGHELGLLTLEALASSGPRYVEFAPHLIERDSA